MHPAEQSHLDLRTSVAPVISLAPAVPHERAAPSAVASVTAVELLHRRAGDRWAELPVEAGRAAARAERQMAQVPIALDPRAVPAADATLLASTVLAAASRTLELLGEEGAILSEALGTEIGDLPFVELHEVADAVVRLSGAPKAQPRWASPAAAAAAEVVLEVGAPDLRAAKEAHVRLYERFTDGVWDVPGGLLAAGRSRARLISRARLRLRLRSVSRTGRLPGRLTPVVHDILAARNARAQLSLVHPNIAHHLGELDRGPLTDVDQALSALRAVRRLQDALGSRLDEPRLQRLLLADAFHSDDVVRPATNVRSTIEAWASDVAAAGGKAATSLDGARLAAWVDDLSEALRGVQAGHIVWLRIGAAEVTLRELVDALLLREHLNDVGIWPEDSLQPVDEVAPGACSAQISWSAS